MFQEQSKNEKPPVTPTEWLTALAEYGYASKPLEEVKSVQQLNNFLLHWPGKYYRALMAEDPQQLQRPLLEVLIGYFDSDSQTVKDSLQTLHHYSSRRLQENSEQFYQTFDAVLEKLGIPISGPRYQQLLVVAEQLRKNTGKPPSEEENHLADLMLKAYQQLRSLGYAHFDLCA